MKIIKWSALVLLSFLTASGCQDSDDSFSFNYNTVLNREFRNNTGRIIPLAYEQAVETNGDISSDGRYFYYTSNRANGNYDIYLRDLNDITTARLTDHAAKDTEPAISPDGKKLLFVSTREDPEGDIYLLRIKPEKLINNEKATVGGGSAADGKAVNLTQIINEDGSVKSVKDSSPVWSPDGKKIAFTSKRDGRENIWIMDSDGKNLSRVTEEGGLYPGFSADGNSLVFISYRGKNSSGDVYVQKNGGKPELAVGGRGIKLFPGFLSSPDEILYSIIEKDTNGDGTVDLKDDSVIMYCNLSTKVSWPLTLPSSSCFNGKWLTNSWSKNHDGLLLFSDIQGENINVNIIPGYGIIPKKTKAIYQYQLAVSYNEEYDDQERYLMALKRVWYFFGNSRDNESVIYTARALNLLHEYYVKKGLRQEADEVLSWMEQLSGKGNLYVRAQYEKISAGGRSSAADIVRKNISLAEKEKDAETILPYLKEDLAGILIERGDTKTALSVLAEIKEKYPAYEEISSVHMEYALLAEKKVSSVFSDSAVYTLENGRNVQKIRMNNYLTELYQKEKNVSLKTACLDSLMKNMAGKKRVSALLCYIKALVLIDQNRENEAAEFLKKASELTGVNDLMHYRSAVLSASLQERNSVEWGKYMAEAVTSYKRVFSDRTYREKVSSLIDYYETEGKNSSGAGDFDSAAKIYDKYRTLIKYIFSYKFFPEMYSIYGPRAHVLYADAVLSGEGAGGLKRLEEEYVKDLFRARIESDKAYIYGLAYIDLMKALSDENSIQDLFRGLADSMENINWALFIDDSFVDPYVLKSWIYQYCDVRRSEDSSVDRICSRYFPEQLWEANIPILERALEANDETLYPEHEGDIHLNLANNYFLLVNYPRAMNHYALAGKYKKSFDSEISHALYCFHYAYCCWQNGDMEKAREQIAAADYIYRTISSEKNIKNYARQFYIIYRYYALFDRLDENWKQAIEDYRRILSFTARYGIETDRARYYQEIAWCYQELNMLDQAADALTSAEKLLEKYPDDEQTYKLTFGFPGIPVLKIWDLGPDTAVIGKNKIFTQLDTRNKKLLNLSMMEKNQVKRSDYAGALEFLQRKISFLEGRKNSVDVESLIITYNNSGVYSVLAGKNDEAEKWFSKAWDLAVKEGYQEGGFSAAMNLSGLYAYELENSAVNSDSEKRISSLFKKISEYRENYENDAYASAFNALKADAKKQDRQVTDEELEEIKSAVKIQSAEACFRIDIALGVLSFYRAEIKRQEPGFSREGSAAEEIYSEHGALYDLYASALEKFQTALNSTGDTDRPLKIKLLLNAGTCLSRMGADSDAYNSFLEAAEEADDSGSAMLIFRSQAALGHFLMDQYRAPGSSPFDAAEHFEKALSCLKEVPVMYISVQEGAGKIYSALTELYIQKGAYSEAFRTDEEKTAFRRAMLYHFSVSSMPSEKLRKLYDRYSDLSAELINRYSALEKGNGTSSAVKEASGSLRSFVSSACKEDPFFCSCMTAECPPLSSVKGTLVRLLLQGENMHIWFLSGGKLSHTSVKADDYSGLKEKLADRGSLFIICNTSLYNLMHRKPEVLQNVKFSLVTSMIQAAAFEKAGAGAASSMFSVSALKTRPDLSVIAEGKEKDPAGYDIIADSLKAPVFTSEFLFSKKLNCEVLITSGEGFLDIYRKAEALSCAGAGCGIITENSDADPGNLAVSLLKNGSDLMSGNEKNLFCFGKYSPDLNVSAGIYNSFRNALKRKDYAEAEILLLRWQKSAGTGSEVMRQFINDAAALNLYQGKYSAAESLAAEAENLSEEERNIYRAWICLAAGKVSEAAVLLAQESTVPDYRFLKEILNTAEGRISSGSLEGISSGRGKGCCISGDQLCLLYAEYLNLAGKKGGRELMEKISELPGAGYTESAFSMNLKCSRHAESLTGDIRTLSDIREKYRDGKISVSGILEKVYEENKGRSAAGVLLLNSDENIYQDFLLNDNSDQIRADSFWMDRLMLDLELAEYSMGKDSLTALKILRNADSGSSVPPCFRKRLLAAETVCFLSMNSYEEAYRAALEAEKYMNGEDDDFRSIQLFLIDTETGSTTPEAAQKRIEKLFNEKNLTSSERIALNLYLSKIELKKLARQEKSTVQDGKVFSRLYSETVSMADKNAFSFLRGIRALYSETAEAYITYLWETGDVSAAFYHAEIKKRILAKGDYGLKGPVLPAVTLKEAEKNLARNEIIICPVKAGNSLLTWVISSSGTKAGKTDGGYVTAQKYLEKCFAEDEPDLAGAGRNFTDLFSEALNLADSAETIYFMPDEFTEKIPFEALVQGEDLLCRKKKTVFLTSPVRGQHDGNCSAVLPLCSAQENLFFGAETAALSESGCKKAEKAAGAFVHLFGNVTAGKDGLPEFSGRSFLSSVSGSRGYFVSETDFPAAEFALYSREAGPLCCLINSSLKKDLNCAFFMDSFYSSLAEGADIFTAFNKARLSLINGVYKNPAYWCYIRLYMNCTGAE